MSEIKVYEPSLLDRDEWRQLQSLQREAFCSTLVDKDLSQINTLVGWDEPKRYYDSHIDPNNEVGKRRKNGQSYTHPRVAIATEYNRPIGFAFGAHNVSGNSERERKIKRLSIIKNYLWVEGIATSPDHQNHGVAKDVGKALLRKSFSLHPVAAYIWPKEIPFLFDALKNLGFSPTGEEDVNLLGEDQPVIHQVRMQATSVKSVLRHLN